MDPHGRHSTMRRSKEGVDQSLREPLGYLVLPQAEAGSFRAGKVAECWFLVRSESIALTIPVVGYGILWMDLEDARHTSLFGTASHLASLLGNPHCCPTRESLHYEYKGCLGTERRGFLQV